MFIMGCPGGKVNMTAVSAKWSMVLTFISTTYLGMTPTMMKSRSYNLDYEAATEG